MTSRDATAQDAATPTDPTDEAGPAVAETSTAPDPVEAAAPPEADSDAAAVEPTSTRRARRHRGQERPPRTRRRRWPLVALLAVAAVFAAAMVVVYFVTRPADVAGLSKSQQAAVTAATQAAVNLQTFRRASFDQDFANALASLTPDFAKQQLEPRKAALQKQLTDGKRDATATALSAGLVSATSTQAVVLVVTNTTQTSDDGQSTPFVFSRLQLTLQLMNGKWLVSDLQSVGLS